jgi:ABC-type branched-subunit amino acid transport system ATPase component
MARGERDEIAELIRDLPGSGLTLLVIEHDVRLMLQLCGWLYVMKLGTCVAEGPPRETASRPEVQEAYLGKDHGFT